MDRASGRPLASLATPLKIRGLTNSYDDDNNLRNTFRVMTKHDSVRMRVLIRFFHI